MSARLSKLISGLAYGASLLCGIPGALLGAETNGPTSFQSFQIISRRNIFCSTRSLETPDPVKPAQPPADSLVLAGTMSYERGRFAFFDGSSPDYKKALKQGDKVGGFVVAEIDDNRATLEAGETRFELSVGTRLVRESGGQWKWGGKADGAPQPLEVASQNIQPAKTQPAVEALTADKQSEANSDKEERKAEKKFIKYLAGLNPSLKEDKKARKDFEAQFSDSPKKHDKLPKHPKE